MKYRIFYTNFMHVHCNDSLMTLDANDDNKDKYIRALKNMGFEIRGIENL